MGMGFSEFSRRREINETNKNTHNEWDILREPLDHIHDADARAEHIDFGHESGLARKHNEKSMTAARQRNEEGMTAYHRRILDEIGRIAAMHRESENHQQQETRTEQSQEVSKPDVVSRFNLDTSGLGQRSAAAALERIRKMRGSLD